MKELNVKMIKSTCDQLAVAIRMEKDQVEKTKMLNLLAETMAERRNFYENMPEKEFAVHIFRQILKMSHDEVIK